MLIQTGLSNVRNEYHYFLQLAEIKGEISYAFEHESNKDIKKKLKKILNIIEEVVDEKRTDVINIQREFEKGVVNEVLNNQKFYKDYSEK